MTREDTQQKVRQRARFLCENPECRRSTTGQYAHIIPDSLEGAYTTDNILFLCKDCHDKFDYSVFRRDSELALKYLTMIKNVKKSNEPIEHLFYFLSQEIVVKIGSGITLIGCRSIFENLNREPLLSINLVDNRMNINGNFFDQNAKNILEIKDNKFFAHGGLLWDLYVRTNGELNLITKDQQIYLNIKQDEDLSLHISGRLFIEGDIFEINERGIYQPSRDNLISNGRKRGVSGIVLSKNEWMI
ncbi:MAG: HNH endonuclease [Bacteroidota bacterium]|nr:HNH endonuclease [Bacteroidota bacterium]